MQRNEANAWQESLLSDLAAANTAHNEEVLKLRQQKDKLEAALAASKDELQIAQRDAERQRATTLAAKSHAASAVKDFQTSASRLSAKLREEAKNREQVLKHEFAEAQALHEVKIGEVVARADEMQQQLHGAKDELKRTTSVHAAELNRIRVEASAAVTASERQVEILREKNEYALAELERMKVKHLSDIKGLTTSHEAKIRAARESGEERAKKQEKKSLLEQQRRLQVLHQEQIEALEGSMAALDEAWCKKMESAELRILELRKAQSTLQSDAVTAANEYRESLTAMQNDWESRLVAAVDAAVHTAEKSAARALKEANSEARRKAAELQVLHKYEIKQHFQVTAAQHSEDLARLEAELRSKHTEELCAVQHTAAEVQCQLEAQLATTKHTVKQLSISLESSKENASALAEQLKQAKGDISMLKLDLKDATEAKLGVCGELEASDQKAATLAAQLEQACPTCPNVILTFRISSDFPRANAKNNHMIIFCNDFNV